LYRALYILNWIYRFFTEPNYRQWIGARRARARGRPRAQNTAPVSAAQISELAPALSEL